jgi:hypothetical protein
MVVGWLKPGVGYQRPTTGASAPKDFMFSYTHIFNPTFGWLALNP